MTQQAQGVAARRFSTTPAATAFSAVLPELAIVFLAVGN